MSEITVHRVPLAAPARSGSADGALRDILRAALGGELGDEPRIVRDDRGKPRLAGGELAFSVAHSGRLAVIAVVAARDVEVGIDVEQLRAMPDAARLAARFFAADEAARVARDASQFFPLWCRKEAWLKARGIGLVGLKLAEPIDGFVADLDVGAGYAAAVACSRELPIRVI
jgi:4'-phosphopantetheinyl transferase|nr:4'-phosphopantetheinyl transferase superfamily protein [Kofleriaceae bacterium]